MYTSAQSRLNSPLGIAAIVVPVLLIVSFASASGTSFAALATMGYGGQPTEYKQSFGAMIEGAQQVPPTSSTATGTAMFNVTQGEGQIDYSVHLSGLASLTGMHLHCGARGSNGPVVVDLLHGATSGTDFTGTITQSDILAAGATCSPNISTLPHLIQAMREGKIYINVHTSAYPNGEIRGQLGDAPTASTGGTPTPPTPPTTPTNTPSVSPSAATVMPGATIDFSGRNFSHEQTVYIAMNGTISVRTAHADGGGNFTTGSFTMPTAPGTYTFVFSTAAGDSASSTITVAGSSI